MTSDYQIRYVRQDRGKGQLVSVSGSQSGGWEWDLNTMSVTGQVHGIILLSQHGEGRALASIYRLSLNGTWTTLYILTKTRLSVLALQVSCM